jgi:hypothetical protein
MNRMVLEHILYVQGGYGSWICTPARPVGAHLEIYWQCHAAIHSTFRECMILTFSNSRVVVRQEIA